MRQTSIQDIFNQCANFHIAIVGIGELLNIRLS
ncbi:hypothetical protein [Bacillus vallismortis]